MSWWEFRGFWGILQRSQAVNARSATDILNIPVETLQGSELGGLGGAIASQQAITGDSLEEAVRKMVRIKDRYEPDQEEHKKYIKKYEVYQEILKSMDTTFRSLKKLNEEL